MNRVRALIRLAGLVLLLSSQSGHCQGAGPQGRCQACDRLVDVAKIHSIRALNNGAEKKACATCLVTAPRCFLCKVPAPKRRVDAPDGRVFCPEDFQAGIFDEQESARIAYETTQELTRLFWRFKMKFPETNVAVSIVDGHGLAGRVGVRFDPATFDIMGLTQTDRYMERGGKLPPLVVLNIPTNAPIYYKHRIFLISGLPRARMVATLAHELGHTWLNENIAPERLTTMSRDSIEGFCELIAYQLMESRYEDFERQVIKDNLYTRGQQNMLIETDLSYGFYKILEWFDKGTVSRLDDPDLVRRVAETSGVVSASPLHWPAAAPVKLSEDIVLKAITGTAKRRIALINNVNLMQGENGRIQLAGTNVLVHCLQIGDDSVVLKLNGTEEKEFFLKPAHP